MDDKCAACRKPFMEGDCIQQLPPLLRLKKGGKSGLLGWYTEGQGGNLETVHVECVQAYFNVEDSPLWDSVENSIRERVELDERDAIRNDALEEFLENSAVVCCECMEDIPPEEIDSVMKTVANTMINNIPLMVNRMPYETVYGVYETLSAALTKKAQNK